jgi:pimeloyl-ACP methyl ester carboxylesterase
MLHGIYGRGRNWQGIAKALVARRPEYVCWLVDLPYHGDSSPGEHGDTVRGLAQDVADWTAAAAPKLTGILGHSFGGKVALAVAEQRVAMPLDVWVIDSTPETKPASGSAWDMMRVIGEMPSAFGSRDEAVAGLQAAGYSQGVAVWMATNLRRDGDVFTWSIDFTAMRRLLDDFFVTDVWGPVVAPAAGHRFSFVKASESSAMSEAAATRLEAMSSDAVRLFRRPGSHWLHAESPEIVIDLLVDELP